MNRNPEIPQGIELPGRVFPVNEKARAQSGGRPLPHIPRNTGAPEAGKPEGLSGSQIENAGKTKIATCAEKDKASNGRSGHPARLTMGLKKFFVSRIVSRTRFLKKYSI
ncbi:hypothetical protein [Fundidesulfovibrio butyratiphilus]